MADETDWPSTWMVPAAGFRKPMMALKSVDLPLPLTPTSAVMLPSGVQKPASLSAVWPLL